MALLGISVQTEVFVPYFFTNDPWYYSVTFRLFSCLQSVLVGLFSAIISSSPKPSGIAQRLMRIGPAINFFTAIIVLGFINFKLSPFTLWASDYYLSSPLFLRVQELAWLGLIISLVYYRFLKGKKRKSGDVNHHYSAIFNRCRCCHFQVLL